MFSGRELFPVIIALMMNSLMPLTQLPQAGGDKNYLQQENKKIVDNRKGVLCNDSGLLLVCFGDILLLPNIPIIRWNHAQRQADKPTGVSLR